jgi:SAM-dependent methyltransferase
MADIGGVGAQSGGMGFYSEQLLPRLQDKVMGVKRLRAARERVCEELEGVVLEIGFGTGLNIPYYPPEVTKVVAIEPSTVCMRIAEPRIAESTAPVDYGGLTGEQLDLPSGEFDAVLSTWTLCTIPNLDAALAEVRRVLKSGRLVPLHRARPFARPKDHPLARAPRADQQTPRGRMPPHPSHLRRHRARWIRDREARHLLLRARAEAHGIHLRGTRRQSLAGTALSVPAHLPIGAALEPLRQLVQRRPSRMHEFAMFGTHSGFQRPMAGEQNLREVDDRRLDNGGWRPTVVIVRRKEGSTQ